jgi:hypothetical protein
MAYTPLTSAAQIRRVQFYLAIAGIGVFMAIFMDRVTRVEAAMERAVVQLAVQNLRTNLAMYSADARIRGNSAEPLQLLGRNPVSVLERTGALEDATTALGRFASGKGVRVLAGYVGERAMIDWNEVAPGNWVFDSRRGELIYRISNERAVETDEVAPKRLRYRLVPHYADLDGNGHFEPEVDRFLALTLEEASRHRWRIRGE